MGGNKGVNRTSSRVSYLPLVLIAMALLGWTTACNRQTGPLRDASTSSDPGASNPPLNPGPPSTTGAPGISVCRRCTARVAGCDHDSLNDASQGAGAIPIHGRSDVP